MTKATNRLKKRRKFKLLKAARWRAQESLCCVALGTIVLGSLSSHDGNAKENVTSKMISKYFKLLRLM